MSDMQIRIADLEARVIALQTLVGDLLRIIHGIAPHELDRRLEAARKRRDAVKDTAPSEDAGREALHLEVAMLEASLRVRHD
jgi:hypothetical protein